MLLCPLLVKQHDAAIVQVEHNRSLRLFGHAFPELSVLEQPVEHQYRRVAAFGQQPFKFLFC